MSRCRAMLAALALLPLVSCGSSGHGKAGPAPSPVRTSADRIDAVAGSTLVIPLDGVPSEAIDVRMDVRLDDQRELSPRLCRVGVSMPRHGPADADPGPWLPAPGEWTALEVPRAGSEYRGGVAVVVVSPPADAVGQGIWVAGVRHNVNWLPTPAALVRGQDAADPWKPVLTSPDPAVIRAALPEAQSPLGRWRYRLLTDGLRPPAPGQPAPADPLAFKDPVIEALARQNEDRWRVALAWLWAFDTDLCTRVKRRLAAVVDFGAGRLAPAWPTDHAALDRLMQDLLDPTLTPARRAELAEAWLDDQPAGVAWIVDDAGPGDAHADNDASMVTVGIANLLDRDTLCWVDVPGERDTPDLRPLPSMSAALRLLPVASPGETARVEAHAGKFVARLPAQGRAIPAVPPGVGVGPLLCDFTMPAWQRSTPELPKVEWNTTALLHRPPRDVGGEGASPWELYVECRLVPGVGSLDRERVRVYLGPMGRPSRVICVDIAGNVTVEQPAYESGGPPEKVAVVRRSGGWSFRLPLPGHSVEPGGALRIAVTRTDSLGRRSAWPRAMLPWQEEPGRALIDTTAWNISQGIKGPAER